MVDLHYIEKEFRRRVRERQLEARACMSEPEQLPPSRQSLLERIRSAYAGVCAGADTILYLSGEAEDEYLSKTFQAELRKEEQRTDWQLIPVDLLAACPNCIDYLDAEGMRYLLPAYMVASLLYPELELASLDYHLTFEDAAELLSLLNDEQRACVTDYVNEMRVEEASEHGGLIVWDVLLPWEEAQRAATESALAPVIYAEKLMLAYCEKHDLPIPEEYAGGIPDESDPDALDILSPEEQQEQIEAFEKDLRMRRDIYLRCTALLYKRLSNERAALAKQIRSAFAGETVAADVPLYLQAYAANYLLPDEYTAKLALQEVRDDWQKIPADLLHACGMPYVDALPPEAMRYLLPAWMLHDISSKDKLFYIIPDYVFEGSGIYMDPIWEALDSPAQQDAFEAYCDFRQASHHKL